MHDGRRSISNIQTNYKSSRKTVRISQALLKNKVVWTKRFDLSVKTQDTKLLAWHVRCFLFLGRMHCDGQCQTNEIGLPPASPLSGATAQSIKNVNPVFRQKSTTILKIFQSQTYFLKVQMALTILC